MLYHHNNNKDYAVAAGEAREHAIAKMNEIIDKGKEKAINGIQNIMEEYDVRNDIMTPANHIDFSLDNEVSPYGIGLWVDDAEIGLTNFSLGQMLNEMRFPKTMLTGLMEDAKTIREQGMGYNWAEELVIRNLRTLAEERLGDKNLLIREVNHVAKGILTDRYRPMDAGPIFEGFMGACNANGMVPVDGSNTETRYHLKMIFPEVYQPAQDEVVCFGQSLTTSDYGNGALELSFWMMRLWCTNFAIRTSELRKIHLGRRFNDPDEYSKETNELDAKAISSAINDQIDRSTQKRIGETCAIIKKASEEKLDVDAEIKSLNRKGVLTKDDGEKAKALYEHTVDVQLLPKEKTKWRWSNVLSMMANTETGDHSIELQQEAARVLS